MFDPMKCRIEPGRCLVDTNLVFDLDMGRRRLLGDEVNASQEGDRLQPTHQILGGQNPSVKSPWDILWYCISRYAELIFPQLIIVFIDVFYFHCYPLKTSLITTQKWSHCSFVLIVVRQAGLVSTIYHHFVNGRLSQKKQIFKTREIGQINGRLLSFSNFSVLQCVGMCMCPCVHAHCGLSRTSEFHQPPSTDSHGYGQSQEIPPSPEKVLFLHLIWATNNGGDIGAVKGYGKVPFNMAHALSCHPHSRHMRAAVQSQQTQQVYFKVYLLIQPYLIQP